MIQSLKDGEKIITELFGEPVELEVFCTGDNRYDEQGDYKEDGFPLTQKELDCLNWLIQHTDLEQYRQQIADYCNERYEMIGDEQIGPEDVEGEISIYAIAVNVGGVIQSKDGFVYPEISFYGDCECDPEHGICIGFRDEKFLGIEAQDWTL